MLMDLYLTKVQVAPLSRLIHVHGGVLDEAAAFLSLSLSLSLFKIRALHCTPLEFRTRFLAGDFNLQVATIRRKRAEPQRTVKWLYRLNTQTTPYDEHIW